MSNMSGVTILLRPCVIFAPGRGADGCTCTCSIETELGWGGGRPPGAQSWSWPQDAQRIAEH